MKAGRWKKIVFILSVICLLGFTLWYGGDAPGLQGFPKEESKNETTVADGERATVQRNKDEKDLQKSTETQATEEKVFQEIIMHITKKESTSDTTKENQTGKKKASYKQVQTKKKAQKNADKAAEEASKKKTSTESKKTTTKSKKTKTEKKTEGEKETSTEKKNSTQMQCTIYISCATVLENMNLVPAAKQKIIPSDGVILKEVKVSVKKGSTVFDTLQTATKENKIHLEYTYTPLYKNYYIEGIYNLYEFECGNGSGWLYSVNDEFPSESCSSYEVENGDVIKWLYTCDFGEDVGKYYEN